MRLGKKVGKYEQILRQLGTCLNAINAEYILSQHQISKLKKALFATGIVKVLLQNVDLLKLLKPITLQDLIDSITTNNNQYIEILRQEKVDREIIILFQSNITDLINNLNTDQPYLNNNVSDEEWSIIVDQIMKFSQKCQILFTKQFYDQEIIDELQAASIAFNIHSLDLQERLLLLDKLLLIRELWQADNSTGLEQVFQDIELADSCSAFQQIIELLVDNNKILKKLTAWQLVYLYDRLKNLESPFEIIYHLLEEIRSEAEYRYSDSRLSHSGIELLKRFQSYDNIMHQIENSEYAITESFLIRNSNFIQEALIFIAKHSDNISAVRVANTPTLNDIITKITSEFRIDDPKDSNSASIAVMLSLIKSKFATDLSARVLRRYSELDKFAIHSLKNRYSILFENIKYLLYDFGKAKEFLHQTIVRKLSQEHYIINISSSVNKLKSLQERDEVASQLAEIDFVEIFNPRYLNSISSLNFRKYITTHEMQTQVNYVHSIIKVVLARCNAAQLSSLHKPLLLKSNLTKTQTILKQEIIKQINQRTTIIKRLYYILSWQKTELDTLNIVKKSL
jgi:hypothetical protein